MLPRTAMPQGVIREAVGVFTDPQDLDAAVAELETTAFPRHDISVLSAHEDISAYAATDNPDVERTVPLRAEEKNIAAGVIIGGGAYAGAITAAFVIGGGAGGLVFTGMMLLGAVAGAALGGLVVLMLAMRLRRDWEKAAHRGGMVLWVRTPAPDAEKLALSIMRRHGGKDVHVHNTH